MAYNNMFPVGYQPMYYPQQNLNSQMSQQQGPQNANSSIIWVQGEAGAKSYLVAPNTTVQLWDSENQVIYLKSADASGMPSMKILDYTIRDTNQNVNIGVSGQPVDEYITKSEFLDFENKVNAKLRELSSVNERRSAINEQSTVQRDERQ